MQKVMKFDKLYLLGCGESWDYPEEKMEDFIIMGNVNSDMYFVEKCEHPDCELLKNIVVKEFDKKDEFEEYLASKPRYDILDYSLNHVSSKVRPNGYLVLEYA